jgi:hypothetical protein
LDEGVGFYAGKFVILISSSSSLKAIDLLSVAKASGSIDSNSYE